MNRAAIAGTVHLTLSVLGGLTTAFVVPSLLNNPRQDQGSLILGFALLCVYSLAHFFTGLGCRRSENKARMASRVLAVTMLVAFPVGTVLGAYLIYLGRRRWDTPEMSGACVDTPGAT